MRTFPLLWIPLSPLIGAAINLLFGRLLGKRLARLIACTAVGIACVLACTAIAGTLYPAWKAARLAGNDVAPIVQHVYTWIESGNLRIPFGLTLDPLSAVMIFTITFVGFLIHVYSIGYMAHDPRQ